jgi:hypothetical protein
VVNGLLQSGGCGNDGEQVLVWFILPATGTVATTQAGSHPDNQSSAIRANRHAPVTAVTSSCVGAELTGPAWVSAANLQSCGRTAELALGR